MLPIGASRFGFPPLLPEKGVMMVMMIGGDGDGTPAPLNEVKVNGDAKMLEVR